MKMLLLSFVLGTPLLTPVADRVPTLNVETSGKGATSANASQQTPADTQSYKACIQDEDSARQALTPLWMSFAAADRDRCESEASSAGLASYVELLSCLQLFHESTPDKVAPSKDAKPKK